MKTKMLNSLNKNRMVNLCFLSTFLLFVATQPLSAQFDCNTFNGNLSISSCEPYTWNGTTYNSSGTYTFTSLNSPGCVNTATLTLNIMRGFYLSVKVLLSGPYDPVTQLMKDSLRQVTHSQGTLQGIPNVGQAINVIPWTPISNLTQVICANSGVVILGGGSPSMGEAILAVSGPDAIVDWVMVELRSANTPDNILQTQWGLLQRDGDLVSCFDGTSPLFFPCLCQGDYYVSVKHRNHLGIMTANPVSFGSGTTVVDFTNPEPSLVWVKPGYPSTITNAPRFIIANKAMMWGGDANANRIIRYNGTANDRDAILSDLGGSGVSTTLYQVYKRSDMNMDGKIRYNGIENDRNWLLNEVQTSFPGATSNSVIVQHTPN